MKAERMAGFTLTEVMVSVVLVGLIFGALATAYPSGITCLRKSAHTRAVTSVAQGTLEQFQQQGYGNLVTMISTPPQVTLPQPAVQVDGVPYVATVILTQISANLVQLQVSVVAQTQDPIDTQPTTFTTQIFNFQNPF